MTFTKAQCRHLPANAATLTPAQTGTFEPGKAADLFWALLTLGQLDISTGDASLSVFMQNIGKSRKV